MTVAIKKLDSVEIQLAKQLILMFGFDDKNSSLPSDEKDYECATSL